MMVQHHLIKKYKKYSGSSDCLNISIYYNTHKTKVVLSMRRFQIALQIRTYCILESFCEVESNSLHLYNWDLFRWTEFTSLTKGKTMNLLTRQETDIVTSILILQLTENTPETGVVYKSVKGIRFLFTASA